MGFEPITNRLKAYCSTIELYSRNQPKLAKAVNSSYRRFWLRCCKRKSVQEGVSVNIPRPC